MQRALELLSELSVDDIDWIFENGIEQQVISDTMIIREGEHPRSVFVVLEGLLGIWIDGAGSLPVAKLGAGELLGEVSFVDGHPASASIKAIENSLLLAVPSRALRTKLDGEADFAARFYRACAVVMTRRLREQNRSSALLKAGLPKEEGAMAQTWGPIGEAVEALKGLFRRADQEAIRNRGEVPESLQAEIEKSFRAFLAFINECAGDHSGLSDSVRYEIGARLQQELLPYLLLTQTAERWYSKPRGYAGDFLTIEWIYRNEPKGTGRLGPLLDRCFLSVAAAQAVRNRRSLLAEHIRDALDRSRGRTAQVTSLACGPAAEIFDAYAELQNPERLRATLIDIDFQALAFVSDKCNRLNLNRFVQLVNGNLVYLATGRQELELSDQDLVYSIGLIDYFNDQFVVTLLDYVHDLLRPGGRVVLGNFESRNPDKAMMDHILDWKLIHRTEDDMNRLFKASRFGRECTDIRYEAAGVNLFAECVRQD